MLIHHTIVKQSDPQALLEGATLIHSASTLQTALDALANIISSEISDSNPIVICVMNGGLVFAGHLLTRLNFPLSVDYVHASRYHNKTVGNALHWEASPTQDLTDRTILLVDDILDEGITLNAIKEQCMKLGAKAVYTTVLVEKTLEKTKPIQADFIGLTVPDAYVFGFGMDVYGWWRNLDGIYALGQQD